MAEFRNHSQDELAGEAGQLLVRLGLAVLAVAVPCGAVLSRRAIFVLFPVGAAVILAGALISPGRGMRQRIGVAFASETTLIALFFLMWCGLSLIWTPFPSEASERFLKTSGTVFLAAAAAAALPARTRTANLYLLPVGLAVATLAILALAARGFVTGPPPRSLPADPDGSTLERAVMALVMLLWPALGALVARGRASLAASLGLVVAMTATIAWSPIALLALVCGALAFVAALADSRAAARRIGAAAALLVLLAPAIPFIARVLVGSKTANLDGALAPLATWLAVVKADGFRLITGHGLDSALRGVAAGYLPANAPRSILFELWYDLGVVGAAAGAALMLRAFRALGEVNPNAAPFLVAGLVGGVVIAVLGLSTAQLAWVTLLSAAGVLFTALVNGIYRSQRPRIWPD